MSEAARIVDEFVRLAEQGCADPETKTISDEDLARVMTAAVKLYSTRAEATADFPPPVNRNGATATDILVAVCEMIRVADVNMFDLSMWFGRPRPKK